MKARAFARSSISREHVTSVAVATSSALAADAAQEIAAAGGNAVDCALAAALLTMNTEPGVCALAGGAFITIWPAGKSPLTIDGNVTVPGAGVAASERGNGTLRVSMHYGGGIETLVGPGSVAVPGSLAAIERAWKTYGVVAWETLFAPTIRAVRAGFPLPAACHYYLGYSGKTIFGRSSQGFAALHDNDGELRDAGSPIVVPDLADTLDAIAREGADLFYRGELADTLSRHCQDGGGMLCKQDLTSYTAIERRPLLIDLADWQIASNPPPAVGGAMLAALLMSSADLSGNAWHSDNLRQLIKSQFACLSYRKQRLDWSEDIEEDVSQLLQLTLNGDLSLGSTSASTVHTSAVDSDGTGCSITASSGYGSGEMPPGTGLWLNNCLGEIELNRRGLDAGPAGARLPSNMAPSVARKKNAVLAIGSPGADRITTALQQVLISYLRFGMPLESAVAHPRVHVDTSGDMTQLMAEPGLDLPDTDLAQRIFPNRAMYFGGVGAALFDSRAGFTSVADPRREGGTCLYND
jgi:gamma-glutamyltranspeptidase/glutathione hydrolase